MDEGISCEWGHLTILSNYTCSAKRHEGLNSYRMGLISNIGIMQKHCSFLGWQPYPTLPIVVNPYGFSILFQPAMKPYGYISFFAIDGLLPLPAPSPTVWWWMEWEALCLAVTRTKNPHADLCSTCSPCLSLQCWLPGQYHMDLIALNWSINDLIAPKKQY